MQNEVNKRGDMFKLIDFVNYSTRFYEIAKKELFVAVEFSSGLSNERYSSVKELQEKEKVSLMYVRPAGFDIWFDLSFCEKYNKNKHG